MIGDEVEEIPLRHERDELAIASEVREIGDRDLLVSDHPGELAGLLMGPLEELLEQAQLVQDLQGRGVDRVAPEIPEKIAMLLEYDDVDARPRQQESEDHPRGAAAHNAACRFQDVDPPGRSNRRLGRPGPAPGRENLRGPGH